MVRYAAIFVCLHFGLCAEAQDGFRTLRFVPTVNASPVELGEPILLDGARVTISQLRFYVSQLRFFDQGRPDVIDSACHLVDASDPTSLQIPIGRSPNSKVDSISFLLGIDSIINVSGAFGGDLDPSNGMYWTWNSGYINWKLEGTSTKCGTAKSEFQFHLGGYMSPFLNARPIGLSVKKDGDITVVVDVSKFLLQAELGARCSIMSPGIDAVDMTRIAATVFSIQQKSED